MWEGWSKAAEAVPAKRTPASLSAAGIEGLPPEWEVLKGSRPHKSRKALAFQLITPQRSSPAERTVLAGAGGFVLPMCRQ